MELRLRSTILVSLCALCAVATAAILIDAIRVTVWSDELGLLSSVQDDSFYYILPSHNFAHGKGFTFGGEPSYGFQPGYAVLLAAIGAFVESPIELFRASLILNASLFLSTGVLLFVSVRGFPASSAHPNSNSTGQTLPALLAASIYIFNSWNYLISTTGKENALAAFLLAALIYFAVVWRDRARTAAPAIAGLLMGALFFTRIAPATLIYFAVFLVVYSKHWRRYIACVCAIPAAWFLYATFFLGSTLPYSLLVKSAAPSGDFGLPTILDSTKYVFNALKFGVSGDGMAWAPQPEWADATNGVVAKIALWAAFLAAFLWFLYSIWPTLKKWAARETPRIALGVWLSASLEQIPFKLHHSRHGGSTRGPRLG